VLSPPSRSPEKVNDWEISGQVGGRPGRNSFFAQDDRSDLGGRRGEISEKGIVQWKSGGFVGGDFVVNQDGLRSREK
jgi:hypothetical protein